MEPEPIARPGAGHPHAPGAGAEVYRAGRHPGGPDPAEHPQVRSYRVPTGLLPVPVDRWPRYRKQPVWTTWQYGPGPRQLAPSIARLGPEVVCKDRWPAR